MEDFEDIRQQLFEDLESDSFDIQKYIEFSNQYIRPEAEKKSYLGEINVITETIRAYIDHLKSQWRNSENELERARISRKTARLIVELGIYTRDFTDTIDINYENEIKLEESYYNKMRNAEELSSEEIEELICMYISGAIRRKKEDYLNYIFRNLLEKKQDINASLYQKIFLEKCESIIKKEKIDDLSLNAYNMGCRSDEAKYNYKTKEITLDSSSFSSLRVIENFLTFFHEKRHYHQLNSKGSSLPTLTYAKDIMLGGFLGKEKYYIRNYHDLSFERDAEYSANRDLFYFILEVAPSKLQEIKTRIIKNLNLMRLKMSKDTTERRKDDINLMNLNLLFESELKKNRFLFTKKLVEADSLLVLLYEYDIRGNKKDLFELLEERDSLKNEKENLQKLDLYNYLIYNEEVSLDYIFSNLKKLGKNIESPYYDEVKEILKQKLVNYFISKNQTRINEHNRDFGENIFSRFYQTIINMMRKSNVEKLRTDNDYVEYLTKEEELKACYKELSLIIDEMENMPVDNRKSI